MPEGRVIPFIDLHAQRSRIEDSLRNRLDTVLEHGRFIMGPEVAELEDALAARTGAAHVVSCGNGTDALVLVLKALGIGRGDAVIVPAFTFSATAEAVALVGGTPVFVDIDPVTYNLVPDDVEPAAQLARRRGLTPRAVIAVDLFGQPADYSRIEPIAAQLGLFLLADAAQSFGAQHAGRPVGTIGGATTTSFFPSKPLGCYGDGGAVLTNDGDLAAVLRSLRIHGARDGDKNHNERVGLNSRLDTLQAAVLLAKLTVFEEELAARSRVAARYGDLLEQHVTVPKVAPESTSVWAQYTIRAPQRDRLARDLAVAGIPTAVYYPRPLHQQPAYAGFLRVGDLSASTDAARRVLSLPMHPYLGEQEQATVASLVRRSVAEDRAAAARHATG